MSQDIRFIDAAALPSLELPESLRTARPFFQAILDSPRAQSSLVRNITTASRLVQMGSHVFPVTINQLEHDNSWVCSPYNAAITYPLEELRHLKNAATRTAVASMIRAAAPALRVGRIDRVVCVNNWLLSTDLYPDWHGAGLSSLTSVLCDLYPGHAILFRSLNHATNARLLQSLRETGYLLAPSRQVYLFDGRQPDYRNRYNSKRDRKLLNGVPSNCRLESEDFRPFLDTRIRELYDLLNLDRHSGHNPQFTDRLIRLWRESGLMKFFGISSRTGELDGVVGTFAMNGVLTAPVVGYDTSKSKTLGLYRMLMAHVMQKAADDQVLLNLSAGAAPFKRIRGGQAEIEYSAVHCRHLPYRQRAAWTSLATLLEHVGARLLKRFRL